MFDLAHLNDAPLRTAYAVPFGLTQPKADRWLPVLLIALQAVLATIGDLPTRTVASLRERLDTLTNARSVTTAADASASLPFYDGAERTILRPADAGDQADDYCGKKKRHTINNLILATADGLVQVLSDTYEGRVHDKAIADDVPYPLPPGSELVDDLGFVGSTLPDGIHTRPTRKPKGGTLMDVQKAINLAIARRRIMIEHLISGIKHRRIVKDTIRLWKEGVLELVMEICCTLHYLRVRSRA